jgi:hypothetical protein
MAARSGMLELKAPGFFLMYGCRRQLKNICRALSAWRNVLLCVAAIPIQKCLSRRSGRHLVTFAFPSMPVFVHEMSNCERVPVSKGPPWYDVGDLSCCSPCLSRILPPPIRGACNRVGPRPHVHLQGPSPQGWNVECLQKIFQLIPTRFFQRLWWMLSQPQGICLRWPNSSTSVSYSCQAAY